MDADLLDAITADPRADSLRESAFGDWVDPRERFWDDNQFFYGDNATPTFAISPPLTTINDREGGQYLPYYRNEQDLALIRGTARRMRSVSAISIGALESLGNYIFGSKGFTLKAKAAKGLEDQAPEGLVATVQKLIDRFADRNDLCGELDREAHVCSREDGEAFVELSRDKAGVMCEFLEPDQIVEPATPSNLYDYMMDEFGIDCDSFVPCWRFGILTPARRTSQAIAYHVVRDGVGNDWDLVPASRMVHFKRNVSRNAKRGVSDLFHVIEDCSNEIKLSRNTVTGAALQASIPWVEEMPIGTTLAGAGALATSQADFQYTRNKAVGAETVNRRRYQAGTIPRLSPGRVFKPGPMGTERADNFIKVGAYVTRRIGIRWTFPEYMISGDASNANYASTMVSESPFVKAREADQHWYGRRFHSMIWKMLHLEFEGGELAKFGLNFQQIEMLIDVDVDAPAVASRDIQKQSASDKIYVDLGVKSIETVQIELGLEPQTEINRGAKPAAPPAQPGAPGQLGPDGKPLNPRFGEPAGVGEEKPPEPSTDPNAKTDIPESIDESTISAAVTTALESVETTEEARGILKQLSEVYP